MLKTKISAIGTAVPKHVIPQSKVVDFMSKMMDVADEDKRKLRIIYRASGIEERYSVIGDYSKQDDFSFYNEDKNAPHPSTSDRMKLYEENAPELAMEAISDCLPTNFDVKSITHLITFSCTGMYAPGLDLDIVERLGLSSNISRTCINFMGCYAAFNAIKAAYAFANAFSDAKILIVGVELCTLHFQRFNEYDHIIANSIFGDGAAAALIEKTEKQGFSLEHFYHAIASEGKSDMAWRIENTGFHMRLSSYVPKILKTNLTNVFEELFASLDTKRDNIDYFAIHPGGKKIVQAVESALDIQKNQISATYDTLKNFGNMSSVSVLFVLKNIFNHLSPENQNILTMAFGPGLTIEAALLKFE
jgi:predicted naringenin-chalcone synthase